MTTVVITIADPAHPPVRAMVEELDAYLVPLYPAESNHLLDIETLRQPEMRFFAAHRGDEVVAIGGCWLHGDYAEVKRIYVAPAARGLGLGRKLIEAVYARADAAGAPAVYWLTQDFNTQARQLYDRIARVTPFIRYIRPL